MTGPDDREQPDRTEGAPHPRESADLIGHAEAEAAFLDSFNADRLHHAWLLTGPRGIGKATLAWRLARFLLATPEAPDGGLFGDAPKPQTLDIPSDHPVARRIEALSEPRLLLIRRAWDDERKRLKTVITVDEVRKLRNFFALSSTDGGRRVVIVDTADEMNQNAANALLKMLEEPPENAVLILISNQPSALLPTIRSRCRVLPMHPLQPGQMVEALSAAGLGEGCNPMHLAALANGSLGEAWRLVNLGGLGTYTEMTTLFTSLPRLDRPRLLKLAESVTGRADKARLDLLMDLFDVFLSRLARTGVAGPPATEAAEGEAALLSRLSPNPEAGRVWAALAQDLSARARQGMAVNLDPAALILDMGFRMNETAARWSK